MEMIKVTDDNYDDYDNFDVDDDDDFIYLCRY
jgi:hypothetical protein